MIKNSMERFRLQTRAKGANTTLVSTNKMQNTPEKNSVATCAVRATDANSMSEKLTRYLYRSTAIQNTNTVCNRYQPIYTYIYVQLVSRGVATPTPTESARQRGAHYQYYRTQATSRSVTIYSQRDRTQ